MRTTTIAALLVTLAACGGDGGLSLTDANSVNLEACAPVVADLTGRWTADEWGCVGRLDTSGGPDCDPATLPWVDGEAVTMAKSGAEDYALTIGGETATAQPIGPTGYGADLAAGGAVTITACANGSALISFSEAGDNTFGAFAHHR